MEHNINKISTLKTCWYLRLLNGSRIEKIYTFWQTLNKELPERPEDEIKSVNSVTFSSPITHLTSDTDQFCADFIHLEHSEWMVKGKTYK